MNKAQEIQEQLNRFRQSDAVVFPVLVKSIDKTNKTAVVSDGQIEYPDVRLCASMLEDSTDLKRIVIYPKTETTVLVATVNNNELDLVVITVDDPEEIEIKINGMEVLINHQGVKVINNGESLKEVLNDYFSEFGKLCQYVANVNTAISAPPYNFPLQPGIAQIQQTVTQNIANRFNTIIS